MNCPASRMCFGNRRRPGLNRHTLTAALVILLYVASAYYVVLSFYVFAEAAAVQSIGATAALTRNTVQIFGGPRAPTSTATDHRRRSSTPASLGRKGSVGSNAVSPTANGSVACAAGVDKQSTAQENRAPVRRLSLSRALLTTLAQYLFNAEARRNVKRLGHHMVEVVKGVPTVDFELSYYQHKESCLTAFDFAGEVDVLGLVQADNIKVKYLPAQHRGVIEYSEHRRSSVEFLKPVQHHKQIFLLPHGCVATTNSTWTALCTTVDPPCFVGRIDIRSSKADPEEPPVPLQPVSNDEFNEKLVADGWDWYTVQDLYENMPDYPKPLTMMWNNDQCIMHAYFETKAIEKTQYLWMKSRQAFQILMEQVDGTLYRKMSGFPVVCGGRKAKDFLVTVKKLEPAGGYKALMSTQVYGESITDDAEEITLKQEEPLLPLDDWDPAEDGVEFTELFSDQRVMPLLDLDFGPFE